MALKLFIWEGFSPAYTGGLAFALAESEEEAKEMVEKERGFRVYEWGGLTVVPVAVKIARCVSGGD